MSSNEAEDFAGIHAGHCLEGFCGQGFWSLEAESQLLQGDCPNLTLPPIWNPAYSLLKFQRVGCAHLLMNSRFVLGDPTGSGKIPQGLGAWACWRDKKLSQQLPARGLIVVNKSATLQWETEIEKFLPGQRVFRVPAKPWKQRSRVWADYCDCEDAPLLITHWEGFREVYDRIKTEYKLYSWLPNTYLILDEVHRLKNPESKLSRMFKYVCRKSAKVAGLTATLIKNQPVDAYHVLHALGIEVMPWPEFSAAACRLPGSQAPGQGPHDPGDRPLPVPD